MGFEPTTSSMPSRRAPNCATAPLGKSLLRLRTAPGKTRSSRFHRDALPTAPRPHLGKAYFDYALPGENTIFPVSPGRAPNCATAPLGKSSLRLRTARGKHDLPGFTGTRSQLRHGPTWEKLTS